MNRRIKNLALATTLLASTAVAGEIESSANVKLSGDATITYKSVKDGDTTQFNETEVNIMIEAVTDGGVEFHSAFIAYDGVQAEQAGAADKDLATKEAYVVAPLLEGRGKLIAGLAPNNPYGTDAFEKGGEDWATKINMGIANGVSATLILKTKKEMEAADEDGDTKSNALRVDGKVSGFKIGAKVGKTTMNEGLPTEMEKSITTGYVTGTVAGFDVGFETISEGDDFDGQGHFLSVSKAFTDSLEAGVAYVTLIDGLKGGEDFAPGVIFDGNVDSSATKDTSALVVPVSYGINDKFTAGATLISAEVLEESATEFDVSLEYAFSESTTMVLAYGTANGDGIKAISANGEDSMSDTSFEIAVEF